MRVMHEKQAFCCKNDKFRRPVCVFPLNIKHVTDGFSAICYILDLENNIKDVGVTDLVAVVSVVV